MFRFVTHLCLAAILLAAFSAGAKEFVEIAHEIAVKELGEAGWKEYVRSTKKKFETWSNDNGDGTIKRYLDDKAMEWAPTVLRGNVKALKTMDCIVALYKEFEEPPLTKISNVMMSHEKDLEELLADFSWERAAQRIKDRKSRFDEDEKKRLAKQ